MAAVTFVFGVFLAGWGKASGGVAPMVFILASIVGYAVEILAGIPAYLLFRRVGWGGRVHWLGLGAALGIVVAAIWPLRILLLNPDVTYGTAAVASFSVAGCSGERHQASRLHGCRSAEGWQITGTR
jgi:hypothetical protein